MIGIQPKDLASFILRQPIIIAIRTSKFFSYYKGHHVYRNRPDFDPFELDHKGNPKIMGHVVVAIGWEYSNGKLSFLIQNSYGKSWGHRGYGFIHESCLDLNWTLIPTVKEGYKVYATSFDDIPEVSITTDWIYHTSAPQF